MRPSPLGSAVKLRYSELSQEIAELAVRVVGRPIIGAVELDGVRTRRRRARVPVVAAGHDRRRDLADPAQPDRAAHPRDAEGALRCAGRSASSRFRESLDVASLVRTVDRPRAVARGAARRARAPRSPRCAAPRRSSRRLVPGDPAPRVGANAAADGRVYLDHSRDIGAFNPCFPTYEIRVDGDRASGTVTLPRRLRGPARARPRRLPRRVLRLGHPAPQLRRRGRRQDDLARGDVPAADAARSPSCSSRSSARSTTAGSPRRARLIADGDVLCEAQMSAVAGDLAALPEVSPRRVERVTAADDRRRRRAPAHHPRAAARAGRVARRVRAAGLRRRRPDLRGRRAPIGRARPRPARRGRRQGDARRDPPPERQRRSSSPGSPRRGSARSSVPLSTFSTSAELRRPAPQRRRRAAARAPRRTDRTTTWLRCARPSPSSTSASRRRCSPTSLPVLRRVAFVEPGEGVASGVVRAMRSRSAGGRSSPTSSRRRRRRSAPATGS